MLDEALYGPPGREVAVATPAGRGYSRTPTNPTARRRPVRFRGPGRPFIAAAAGIPGGNRMARRSSTTAHRRAARPRRPAAASRTGASRNGAARNGASRNGTGAAEVIRTWEAAYPKDRERKDLYPFTISGLPIKPLYGPGDLAQHDYRRDLGVPGEYPFTRGIH